MPGLEDLPVRTECKERSLKVLDNEIEKIKERDKKVYDLGGYKKYQKLVKDKQEDSNFNILLQSKVL